MTSEEAATIKDFTKCDFKEIHAYYKERSEERKAMTKEQKAALKAENERIVEEYGWCMIDGHKEKIGNFKIEPPGLFRGRGDHPKQGKIKVRNIQYTYCVVECVSVLRCSVPGITSISVECICVCYVEQ